MIFFSCENSSSPVRHQLQLLSSSYPLTYISTSTFFNCERMTIFLFKYHCALQEDGILASAYGEFSEDLFEQIFDTIGNEPAVFPFRFDKLIRVSKMIIVLLVRMVLRLF